MATSNLVNGSCQEEITRRWKEVVEHPQQPRTQNPPLSDPNNMQTGAFLQLFTNSVNTALHKQHCTCNGKSYDANELIAKSNPGLFGPNEQGKGSGVKKPAPLRPDVEVKLPPVTTSKAPDDIIKEATRGLKQYLKKHVGGNGSSEVFPRPCKALGDSGVVELKEELRLPHIMEICDRNGNNWKIIQDASNRSRQRLKQKRMGPEWKTVPAISTQKMPLINAPDDSSRPKDFGLPNNIQGIDSNAIDTVTRLNTPIIHVRVPAADVYSDEIFDDQGIHLPDLQPRIQPAQTHTWRAEAATPKDVPDDMTRKILLGRWAASVRTGKMTYSEYLRKVSLMSMLQRSDTLSSKQDMLQNHSQEWSSEAREKRPRTRSLEYMIANEHSPKRLEIDGDQSQLNPSHSRQTGDRRPYMTGVISPGNSEIVCSQPLPPELERLYTRSSSRVPTLDLVQSLNQHLPADFLDQERHKLRKQYPMYNFKREKEQIHTSNQFKSKSVPANISFQDSLERPMTNEPKEITLQSNVLSTAQQKRKSKPRRLNSRLGYNSICVTGGRISTQADSAQELEALGELQRQYLEQQTLNDVTPDSGLSRVYNVPHQPPTTPVDANATLASISLPELLAQMAEEANINRISEEAHDKLVGVLGKVPPTSEPKGITQLEPVNVVTIEAETSCLKPINPRDRDSFIKDPKAIGINIDNKNTTGTDVENDTDLNDADETFSLKSELLEGKADVTAINEGSCNDQGFSTLGTKSTSNSNVRNDLKASIKQLEIADVNGLESQMTTISSRSLERMMSRLPARMLKSRDSHTRRSRTIGIASGITANKRAPVSTQHVVFVSPALSQGKA